MRTLHLDLKTVKGGVVALRCFWDNPNEYADRTLCLSEIAALTRNAEETYYVKMQADLATVGQTLFNWLDGNDRWLVSRLGQHPGEVIVLAIAVAGQLAHLPWEVLHDGAQFLVQRYPAVVPVRWLSSDQVTQLTLVSEPQNRALRVLFMATSPRAVEPVLDYEQEEAAILKATERPSIELVVEESGCLEELGYLADSYGTEPTGKRYFDVVHVTGHATIADGQPKFITETTTGDAYYASPVEIARTLKTPLPPLLFLSGCRTGRAGNAGAVPSMAEQLLQAGATAVLGWGQNVLDTDATSAAAALYESLARSNPLAEAVALTYQALIKQKARDWHLLRLYVAKTLPGPLVTPERTLDRQRAPSPSMATAFLDPLTQTTKVPTRESFVGRRRQLQNCLQALTQSPDRLGVLIHGMGGLGKSSLAARLCDRLPQFKRLVWQGRIDPAGLVNHLADALKQEALRQQLKGTGEDLKYRLRGVFEQLAEQREPPFLLILDDFEENLEARGTGYVLKAPAAEVLQALIWAIQDTDAPHRLILTSRYDFELQEAQVLMRQPMDALQGADLRKKCERLSALKPPKLDAKATDEAKSDALERWRLQEQAKQLADGNPRLLETLNDEVLAKPERDPAAALEQLAADPSPLRNQVIEERVLQQLDGDLRELLARGLVFELPVPRAAFATVTLPPTHPPTLIDRAIALGVLEASPDDTLRVPRLLPLTLPDDPALFTIATQTLYTCWWQTAESTEARVLEVHRLALLAQTADVAAEIGAALGHQWYNQSRFREAVALAEKTVQVSPDYRVYHSLARSQATLGHVQLALENYQKALATCPDTNTAEKAAILHNSAGIYAQQGQVEQAIDLYQQSLAAEEAIGNVQGKAATLHCLAIIYAQQGQVEQAIDLYQQSLALKEAIGDVQGKAATLHCLAIIYAQQGQVEQAIDLYQQSLAAEEAIGNVQGKAATLHCLAIIYAQQGQVEQAIDLYQQSLAAEEAIGNVQGKAATLHQLAGIYAQQGQVEQAIDLYQQSLAAEEAIGNVQGKAATLHQLAGIYAQQGQVEQAIDLYQQSLALHEAIGNVQGKAATLHQLAGIYAQQGQVEQAIDLYQQSLALHEAIGNVQGKAATLHCLAIIYAQQGQVEQAIDLYQQSLAAEEAIGNVQGKAATLHQLAGIYAQQGQVEQAIDLYQQSLALHEAIGNVQGKAATLAQMASLAGAAGDKERQFQLNLQAAEGLAQVSAYPDLFTVLTNLGTSAADNPQPYLAQALWLGLRLQTPLTALLNLLRFFYNQVPQGDAIEALLATTAFYLCQVRGEGHPQLDDLQNTSLQMLAGAAAAQGTQVDSMEALGNWMSEQQLNDPQVFLPALNQHLETMVGDQWLFDPSVFQ